MYMRSSHHKYWLSLLIAASLLSTGLLPPVAVGQDRLRKPIVVSFGQPNIWSLDQAHYLLARMHMTNLDLQAKTLLQSELDPNATHGVRIQIIRQLLEVGAQFDQGIGFQNNRIVEQTGFNDTRRRELITNRDRMRANSLQLERDINQLENERSLITDATSDRAKQLDAAIKQKNADQAAVDKEITFHDSELGKLGAEPTGTPTSPTPSSSPFDKARLPTSILDKLTEDELKKLADPGRDPKLNATTMLDNTVQLQYEIIAKQLTLLRDEVGPGERLVFLELPQSIYSTPGSGDEKMAQTWWHVNGYTRTDPLVRLLLELYEIEWKWKRIQRVQAFAAVAEELEDLQCNGTDRQTIQRKITNKDQVKFGEMFFDFRCERETARDTVLRNLFREASSDFDRVEQGGARDTSKVIEAIRRVIDTGTKRVRKVDVGERTNLSSMEVKEAKTHQEIVALRDNLLEILSNPTPDVRDGPAGRPLYSFDQGIEFITLEDELGQQSRENAAIERRTVRAVDIIPRQSSLNVNDIQETVKATGILAAFKFLFGFAGQVNFQRQREQFEQFVHQELYASGFGKGNRDFGWTFGALPGTNRVAPGVRTTYAALVVPDDADSMVLSARGCYFPRKSYQPLDFEDTSHPDWTASDKFRKYNCGDQQTYILPIPGGGNTSNFWVTSVSYQPVKVGEFVTVSVRGNNFSSQMGVLVNGIPLFATVGLAQPHLMPRTSGAVGAGPQAAPSECTGATNICGRYERIDPQQIVFSFKMPANSTIGIPTITLVAPGKSVDLNSLPDLHVNGRRLVKKPDRKDERLVETEETVEFMFGVRPSSVLSITDLLILNGNAAATSVDALMTGTGFDRAKDTLYINGMKMGVHPGTVKIFKSPNLYELKFSLPAEESVKVAVVQDRQVVARSFANPGALKITNATVLRYDPPVGNKAGVMIVKVEGSGFTPPPRLELSVEGARQRRLVYVSPNEVIVRLTTPEPPLVIRLRDTATGASVSKVIEIPPAP